MSSNSIWQEPSTIKHSHLLVESYQRICGKKFPLNNLITSLPEALYTSEYVIVSHGIENDPVFNYANQAAQRLWGMNWETFTQLPSRSSAREDKVEKRDAALKEAFRKGYISGYEGIRIDATGKEFYIRNVTLWNIADAAGVQQGQAAIFNTWEYLS
ncbi:MAG: hypothetical protein JWO58_660 [Chitinophagaceae bacterium]|nr:hypothetical protein [Chitinophagaceae bacterium]